MEKYSYGMARFHPMRRRDAANVYNEYVFIKGRQRAGDRRANRAREEKRRRKLIEASRREKQREPPPRSKGKEARFHYAHQIFMNYFPRWPKENEEANERRRKNLSLDVDEVSSLLSRRIRR